MKSNRENSFSTIVNAMMNSRLEKEAEKWETALRASGCHEKQLQQHIDEMKLNFQQEFVKRFPQRFPSILEEEILREQARLSAQQEITIISTVDSSQQAITTTSAKDYPPYSVPMTKRNS